MSPVSTKEYSITSQQIEQLLNLKAKQFNQNTHQLQPPKIICKQQKQ